MNKIISYLFTMSIILQPMARADDARSALVASVPVTVGSGYAAFRAFKGLNLNEAIGNQAAEWNIITGIFEDRISHDQVRQFIADQQEAIRSAAGKHLAKYGDPGLENMRVRLTVNSGGIPAALDEMSLGEFEAYLQLYPELQIGKIEVEHPGVFSIANRKYNMSAGGAIVFSVVAAAGALGTVIASTRAAKAETLPTDGISQEQAAQIPAPNGIVGLPAN